MSGKRRKKPNATRREYWVSFASEKGEGFLGACLVSVTLEDVNRELPELERRHPNHEPTFGPWLNAVIVKTHRLGINPGGQVASWDVTGADHGTCPFDTLLTRAEIDAIKPGALSIGDVEEMARAPLFPDTKLSPEDRAHDRYMAAIAKWEARMALLEDAERAEARYFKAAQKARRAMHLAYRKEEAHPDDRLVQDAAMESVARDMAALATYNAAAALTRIAARRADWAEARMQRAEHELDRLSAIRQKGVH
jgi:hypothetical protein